MTVQAAGNFRTRALAMTLVLAALLVIAQAAAEPTVSATTRPAPAPDKPSATTSQARKDKANPNELPPSEWLQLVNALGPNLTKEQKADWAAKLRAKFTPAEQLAKLPLREIDPLVAALQRLDDPDPQQVFLAWFTAAPPGKPLTARDVAGRAKELLGDKTVSAKTRGLMIDRVAERLGDPKVTLQLGEVRQLVTRLQKDISPAQRAALLTALQNHCTTPEALGTVTDVRELAHLVATLGVLGHADPDAVWLTWLTVPQPGKPSKITDPQSRLSALYYGNPTLLDRLEARIDRQLRAFYVSFVVAKDAKPTFDDWRKLGATDAKDIKAGVLPPVGRESLVMSLCTDLRGCLWVGTEEDGVWRYDPSADTVDQWTHFTRQNTGGRSEPQGPVLATQPADAMCLGDDNGYTIACDKLGRTWVGNLNHGVSVYDGRPPEVDPKTGCFRGWKFYDVLDGPLGERVFDIATCPTDGDVWIATNAGLTRFSLAKETWSYYTRAEGLLSDQVQALAFDPRDGDLYAGTQCDGLAIAARNEKGEYPTWRNVQGPTTMPSVPTGDGLPTNLINDVVVTKEGTIFVATTTGLAWSTDGARTFRFLRGEDWRAKGEGLYKPPPRKDIEAAATRAQGKRLLSEDYVNCLAEGGAGRLWVGHRQKGHVLLDTQELLTIGSAKAVLATIPPKQDKTNQPDYINAILPAGSPPSTQPVQHMAEAFVGAYAQGISRSDRSSILTPPTDAPLVVAQLPAGAKAPTVEELNAMLARLLAVASEPATAQPAVIALPDDWRTQGDWLGRYGRYWASLCAMRSPADFYWGAGPNTVRMHARLGPHFDGLDGLRYWVHWLYTTDRRSLEMPRPYLQTRVAQKLTSWDVGRRQAEWDDHGEAYPLERDGPHIRCSLQIPEGHYFLSLYDFNKDGIRGSNRLRDYRLSFRRHDPKLPLEVIRDFEGEPELARGRIRDFRGGVWKRFLVRGPAEVTLEVNRNHSYNSLLAGVMLDLTEEAPPPYFSSAAQWEKTRQAQRELPERRKWEGTLAEWPARFAARASLEEASIRLIEELYQLRLAAPQWWASNAPTHHVRILRALRCQYTAVPPAAIPGRDKILTALGSCYYGLGLYADWEFCQGERGLVSARRMEQACRSDGKQVCNALGFDLIEAMRIQRQMSTKMPEIDTHDHEPGLPDVSRRGYGGSEPDPRPRPPITTQPLGVPGAAPATTTESR